MSSPMSSNLSSSDGPELLAGVEAVDRVSEKSTVDGCGEEDSDEEGDETGMVSWCSACEVLL